MLAKNQLIEAAQGVIDICRENNESCNIAAAMNFLKEENEAYQIYRLLENYSPIECRKIVYHFIAANILENASMDAKLTYLYCNLDLTFAGVRDEAITFFEKHY